MSAKTIRVLRTISNLLLNPATALGGWLSGEVSGRAAIGMAIVGFLTALSSLQQEPLRKKLAPGEEPPQ